MGATLVVLLLWILLIQRMASLEDAAAACNYTEQMCGDTRIPYPFGMHHNCGLQNYRIDCKQTALGLLPFFRLLQLDHSVPFQVLHFSTSFLIISASDFKATSCNLAFPPSAVFAVPDPLRFRFSPDNLFAVIGCNSTGNFSTFDDTGLITSGGTCTNGCSNSPPLDFCNSQPCCAVGLPRQGATVIRIRGPPSFYASAKYDPALCGYSMVLDPITYSSASGVIPAGDIGIKLSWGIPFPQNAQDCSTVSTTTEYACAENSDCVNVVESLVYACNCSRQGYAGDGYKNGTGCKDIDECADPGMNKCTAPQNYGNCTNLLGSYRCSCREGAVGNGIIESSNGTGCTQKPLPTSTVKTTTVITATFLSTAAAIGFTGLLVRWIYIWRTSRVKKAMYFERNGGIRLKEYISITKGRETPRLFSESELQKATQNFAGHLELGRGGYGTVYKGILADATVVAIKKSHHTEQQEVDQFINEVIILSQINHRNIVQLLGCCLETPVPILVYEYVPSGTLSDHLQKKDGRSALSWESRLVIALESAQAFAYLHSSISTPIYHRDIKSSNILLDRALTPKVADFGISRLLRMDQTHVSTVVKGTMGYLDPEYFQTFQLTDKSDVYSFAVVLLELITSLKPVAMERGETESNLAMLCISRWRTATFSAIIDPDLRASEDPRVMGSVNQVAKLAIACLQVDGHKRPSMKAVFEELLWIRGSKESMVEAYSSLDVEEDKGEDVLPLFQTLVDSSSFRDYSTGASSSRPSGLQELEMTMRKSLREGGR